MKNLLILLFITFLILESTAQTGKITRRQNKYYSETYLPDLIRALENSMNIIADKSAYPADISYHINKIVNGSSEERIFYDKYVSIESDVAPGSDTLQVKNTRTVLDYLGDFNSLYTKSNENTVSFQNIKVSPLKKTTYYYYNVSFDCFFSSTDIAENKYNTVYRIAEVRLLADSGEWLPYINGIRFRTKDYQLANDTLNVFRDFTPDITDHMTYDEYLNSLLLLKSNQKNNKLNLIRLLLIQGDEQFANGEFTKAKTKYTEAWGIDSLNNEVVRSLEKVNRAINEKYLESQQQKRKEIRTAELRIEAVEAYDSYDFKLAALLYDSLFYQYGISNDTNIDKKRAELAFVNSVVDRILNSIRENRFNDALKQCDRVIKEDKIPGLIAECYYRKGLIFHLQDSTKTVKTKDQLTKSLQLSNSKHPRALMLLATVYKNDKKFDDAIQTASILINQYSNNPSYYIFRAKIHEDNKNSLLAIDDYSSAVKLRNNDTLSLINKARLEYHSARYAETIKSTSEAIAASRCNAMAYYFRALANEKLKEFRFAGKDFRQAVLCGLDSNKQNPFRNIANDHFHKGMTAYNNADFSLAVERFSIALLLDSNEYSFFWKGKAYQNLASHDSAVIDFTNLLRIRPKFQDAHYERGKSFAALNNYEAAKSDFNKEIENYPESYKSFLERAKLKFKIKEYENAAKDAAFACTKMMNDSACQLAAEAYLESGLNSEAIKICNFAAKDLRSRLKGVFYLRGRGLFNTGDLKNAYTDLQTISDADSVIIADANYWKGRILFKWEKYPDAIDLFFRATRSTRYKADAYYYKGLTKIKLRAFSAFTSTNLRTALDDFSTAVRLDSSKYKNAFTYSWIGYCSLSLFDEDKMHFFLTEAENQNAGAEYHFVYACWLTKNNAFKFAYEELKEALKKSVSIKAEITNEPLLKPWRENPKLKILLDELLNTHFK